MSNDGNYMIQIWGPGLFSQGFFSNVVTSQSSCFRLPSWQWGNKLALEEDFPVSYYVKDEANTK